MPSTLPYLALLRGINVGGNNIIRMADLKACFEDLNLTDVRTYIQSGNVIFMAPKQDTVKLTKKIEKALSDRFGYESKIVLISLDQLRHAVEHAPKGFGTEPTKYRYDVLFLRPPLTAKEAIKDVPTKEGVDEASAGKEVLYFRRLTAKATQSRMSRIVALPIYKEMTIRNWNTTTKLLGMMEAE